MTTLFEWRVQALKDSWEEARLLSAVAGHQDRQSQFELLHAMHGWCADAVAAVRTVYDDGVALVLSESPEAANFRPCFSLEVLKGDELVAWLDGASDGTWSVSVCIGRPGEWTAIPTPHQRGRRTWSRPPVEELVLRLLASFERQREPGPRAAAAARPWQEGTGTDERA